MVIMTEGDITNDAESNTKYKDGVNRNARLIVRNISFQATEDSLKEHFSSYGTVEEVKLLRRPDGKLVGSGFVHFTHVPMATKALAATNKKPFMGRPIFVAFAVPKHKYVQDNEAVKSDKKTKNAPSSDFEEVKKEVLLPDEEDNKIRINRNARLIVRNVSFKASEESLKAHFEPYGVIQEVKLLKKPDGKLVGCAFVHFKNVPMAKKALLNTNMKPFLGRPISVDWAVAKDKYMQHVVSQQIEMEENVKKEESDSDYEDNKPLNISNEELKQEIKSESENSSDAESSNDENESADEDDENDEDQEDEEESDDEEDAEDEEDDDMEDNRSVTSTQAERKCVKLNDAEDGLTVFLTNVPFSVDNDQLKEFAEKTGPVQYALICLDKLTEHSKGSGFVKFVNQEDASKFLSLPPEQLRIEGQAMVVKPALKRENLQKGDKKQPKDNRNLYLVKEGVVVAGTKAAVGVSASDMSKRLTLERSKTQMLKNLNRFVSRYRLVVANLPPQWDDARLRRECARASARTAQITEARIMRDLRAPPDRYGKHPSKGYGFVMFTRHEDALACLRKLNNNPDVVDKNNRPIVSFSIEDRTALNARKKRLERSIANNPLAKNDANQDNQNRNHNNRKRKQETPDESFIKKRRFEKLQRQSVGQFVKRPVEEKEYTGLTAKEGTQHKMRNNHKLRAQAEIHRDNVKKEKKNSKHARRLKMAARERVKQPKQKMNPKGGKRKKFKDRSLR